MASNNRNKKTMAATAAAKIETVASIEMEATEVADKTISTIAKNNGMKDATIDNNKEKK